MSEWKVITGDALSVMREMPNASIDFIFADYPFNSQDGRTDYFDFVKQTAIEFLRIAKPVANLVVVNNPANIFRTSQYFQDWDLVNEISLIRKGSLRPAYHFGFQHNTCLVLNRGGIKNKWNGTKKNHDKDFLTDVIEYQNGFRGKNDAWHPQAMPISLVKKLVSILSDEHDLVLDCFCGSGTTGVACGLTRRQFRGIECNSYYAQMSSKRISHAYGDLALFAAPI